MDLLIYYQRYIDRVEDITIGFEESEQALLNTINPLTEKEMMYAYEKDKWTIKEVVQHIIDTERIFSYRILCLVRGEKQNLLGFDENEYVKNSNANRKTKEALLYEFQLVRTSVFALIESLEEEDLQKKGKMNGFEISVKQVVKMLIGHVLHHITILEERYLKKMNPKLG